MTSLRHLKHGKLSGLEDRASDESPTAVPAAVGTVVVSIGAARQTTDELSVVRTNQRRMSAAAWTIAFVPGDLGRRAAGLRKAVVSPASGGLNRGCGYRLEAVSTVERAAAAYRGDGGRGRGRCTRSL